jgi:YD repeat-containing protein
MLAAPILIPGPAPVLAPLATSLPTTHRVISYTYPSTLPFDLAQDELRTGDSLYRLITATYSSGEYYHYTCDAVGNRLSLVTSNGSTSYEYDAANRLVLSSYCAESKGEIEVLTIENS